MWVSDSEGRNAESWFVSRALRQLPARIVVSYAETARGHHGYIYRALGFRYPGWSRNRIDYRPSEGEHSRGAVWKG